MSCYAPFRKQARQRVQQTIRRCVENIVRMIGQHGWFRVRRQMKQSARAREFVCSMLYLMRTGITYQVLNSLPKSYTPLP